MVNAGINVKPVTNDYSVESRGKKDKIILFIGRCFFQKGGSLVTEAFKLLRKDYSPNIKLVIAGPKSWPLIGEIPEGVIFLGDASWEIIRECYITADVYCMPSYFEGFGIVFTESLSHGVPCIGRKIQAMPEIIKPGVNGYLLNNESVEELAKLIIKVLEDDKMKSRVKKMSKDYKDYYSWDRVASDMVRIIKTDQIKTDC